MSISEDYVFVTLSIYIYTAHPKLKYTDENEVDDDDNTAILMPLRRLLSLTYSCDEYHTSTMAADVTHVNILNYIPQLYMCKCIR